MRRQRARRRLAREGFDTFAARQVFDHRVEIRRRHGMGDQARRQCVAQPDARAGQAQIQTHLARTARQEMAAAHIGNKADPGFRHSESQRGVRQAQPSMHRHARAAAQHETMQQGDIGLGI